MNTRHFSEHIPDSVLPYPEHFTDKLKYFAWKIITPCHNFWRDLLLKIGILKHDLRQDYLFGKLTPEKTLNEFVAHLVKNGYANHFIAWRDSGELVSVRKLFDFDHQYHLRVFHDGEVRGHFEYTPESHIGWHMKEVGMRSGDEVFLDLLNGWVVPASASAVGESVVRED